MHAFKVKTIGYLFSAASVALLAYAASVDPGAVQTIELAISVCLSLTGMFLRWFADHQAERARSRQAAPAKAGAVAPLPVRRAA